MIKSALHCLLAGICAASLAGCAGEGPTTAGAETGKDCFFPSQVNGFSRADNERVLIHTGVNDRYLFETFGYCPDLDFTEQLALEPVGVGTICRGLDVNLIVPSVTGPRKCPIRMIRKLIRSFRRLMRRTKF